MTAMALPTAARFLFQAAMNAGRDRAESEDGDSWASSPNAKWCEIDKGWMNRASTGRLTKNRFNSFRLFRSYVEVVAAASRSRHQATMGIFELRKSEPR
jgi:hypothetical protein